MSRHAKFYTDLKRGEAYGDDYYDEDDDYDYDDEGDYVDEEPSPKQRPGAAATKRTTSQQPQQTSAGKPTGSPAASKQAGPTSPAPSGSAALSAKDADYDLLVGPATMLKELMGDMCTMQTIVDTLRQHNYDVDAAGMALTVAPKTPVVASPKSTSSNSKGTFTATTVKLSSGGKTLKLGALASPVVSTTPQVERQQQENSEKPASHVDPTATVPATAADAPASSSETRQQPGPSPQCFGPASEVRDSDGKQTCTIIISGHVDSGKSTILGHILYQLGVFSDRDIEKNEKEGRSSGKQSFKYAWLLDQSEEERRRGITIDSGSQCFETEHKRVHILDAPGHKDFVMNMICSATQADIALLVVTAATGEFESGLQYGTKEHLTVLRTLGVGRVVVAVNKMDSVEFSEDRYQYVVREVTSLMRQTKFKDGDLLGFIPVSGLTGVNLVHADRTAIPWYTGPSLIDVFDAVSIENRLIDAPLRLSVQDVQKQTVYGRVEAGKVAKGDTVLFVPCNVKAVVKSIDKLAAGSVKDAYAGDTIELSTNSDLTGLYTGCVGCSVKYPIAAGTEFECHIQTFSSLKNAILPGASFKLAVHALSVDVTVACLVAKMDKNGAWSKGMVKCIPADTQGIVVLHSEQPLALEPAETVRTLGRFVLRQLDETVGGGMVLKVLPGGHHNAAASKH